MVAFRYRFRNNHTRHRHFHAIEILSGQQKPRSQSAGTVVFAIDVDDFQSVYAGKYRNAVTIPRENVADVVFALRFLVFLPTAQSGPFVGHYGNAAQSPRVVFQRNV